MTTLESPKPLTAEQHAEIYNVNLIAYGHKPEKIRLSHKSDGLYLITDDAIEQRVEMCDDKNVVAHAIAIAKKYEHT